MVIPFKDSASGDTQLSKTAELIDKATHISAEYSKDTDIGSGVRPIPDEALLLVLFDDPSVQDFLKNIRGVHIEKLKEVIESYCINPITGRHTNLSPRTADREDTFINRLSQNVQWDLKHINDKGYNSVPLFHSILLDKLLPSNPHSNYSLAGLSHEKLLVAIGAWSSAKQQSNEEQPQEPINE